MKQIPIEWKEKKISDICTNITKTINPQNELPQKYIGLEHIEQKTGRLLGIEDSRTTTSNKIIFKKDDILFGKLRPNLRKYYLSNFDGVCATEFLVLRSKADCLPNYLYFLIQEEKFLNEIISKTYGTKMPRTSWNEIKEYSILLPTLKEQQKIAEILSSVDAAIEKTEQVIAKTEEVKKGLMQQLLTKGIGHTQFKETEIGQIPVEWEYVTIDNIFSEYKETTNDISNYPLYSLTIEEGLVPKSDRYERSFLLKDKDNNQYRMVKNNNVVFNPMNLRLGAITLYTENKPILVSAYYNILSVNDNLEINPRYFGYLFSSSKYINLYERVSTGSLVEKKRVHLSQFLKIYIPIPPLQEQNYIVKVIDSVEIKIKKENKNLIKLKECKQGLMQQLLTGQIRVKVD